MSLLPAFLPCTLHVLCYLHFTKFGDFKHCCVFAHVALFPWNVSTLPHPIPFCSSLPFKAWVKYHLLVSPPLVLCSLHSKSSIWNLLFIDHFITVVTGIENMYLFSNVLWGPWRQRFYPIPGTELILNKHLLNELDFFPFLIPFIWEKKQLALHRSNHIILKVNYYELPTLLLTLVQNKFVSVITWLHMEVYLNDKKMNDV